MSLRTRRSRFVLVALALLAGFGLLLVGESFSTGRRLPGRDALPDVQWAAGSIAIVTPDLTPTLAWSRTGRFSRPDHRLPSGSERPAASRGPPPA